MSRSFQELTGRVCAGAASSAIFFTPPRAFRNENGARTLLLGAGAKRHLVPGGNWTADTPLASVRSGEKLPRTGNRERRKRCHRNENEEI